MPTDTAIELAERMDRLTQENVALRAALSNARDSLLALAACANVEVAISGSVAWRDVRDDVKAQCETIRAALGGNHE